MANWSPDRQQAVQAEDFLTEIELRQLETLTAIPARINPVFKKMLRELRARREDPNKELAAKDAEIAKLNSQIVGFGVATDAALEVLNAQETEIAHQQADLTRLAEVEKADRDRAERFLSALDWAGDISEWNYDGSWTARKDWRTVILDALFPLDAKEAARE